MQDSFSFKLLADCPEHIPYLANLHYQELGKIWLKHASVDRAAEWLKEHVNRDRIPLTLVAFDGDKPIGMASLREDDGLGNSLTPWLGSLITDPSYRGKQLGIAFIEQIKEIALGLKYENLYLCAFDFNLTKWYESLGWKHIGKDILSEHTVYVMEFPLRETTYAKLS